MTTIQARSYLGYVLMRSGQSAGTLRATIGQQAEALEVQYQADMRQAQDEETEALQRELAQWLRDQAAIEEYEIWLDAYEMLASDAEFQGASE